MPSSVSRPGSVTLVAVLTLISGVLDIIGGSVVLFQSGVDAVVEKLEGAAPLIGSGLLTILVGSSPWGRFRIAPTFPPWSTPRRSGVRSVRS